MNNSNWTGRAPRTLNQAFGPQVSPYKRYSKPYNHWFYAIACLLAAIGLMIVL